MYDQQVVQQAHGTNWLLVGILFLVLIVIVYFGGVALSQYLFGGGLSLVFPSVIAIAGFFVIIIGIVGVGSLLEHANK